MKKLYDDMKKVLIEYDEFDFIYDVIKYLKHNKYTYELFENTNLIMIYRK